MKTINGLYLHFPFCRHLCNYCDFYKHKLEQQGQVKDFESVLKLQMNKHKELLNTQNFQLEALETFYIGGGTPSLWANRGSEFLKEHFFQEHSFANNYEFTIEVDPGTWTEKEIDNWRGIGVNRFSIGIQSFDENYLKVLDREHSMKEAMDTLEYFKSLGSNYSVDLMLGLPKLDTKRDIIKEIESLIHYNPQHFSVYILKCRKNYPHLDKLPEEDEVADEYLRVCNYLNQIGYKQYEVSNFALEGKESIHNKKYWKYESVAALGPNASGLLVKDKDHSLRYQWKSLSDGFITEELTGSSLQIEKIYMQLRAMNCFEINHLSPENKEAFLKLIKLWKSRGYVADSQVGFELTAKGYLMLDSLMDDVFNTLSL